MRSFRFLALLLFVPFGVACAEVDSLESTADGTGCGPNGCFNKDAASDAGVSDVSTDIGDDAASEGSSQLNPLCGYLGSNECNPDDPEPATCSPVSPQDGGVPEAEAGPDDGGVESGDGGGDGGGDADPHVDAPSMGGSQEPSDDGDPNDGPGPQDMPTDDEPEIFSCQVTADSQGERVAKCMPGGTGLHNDPCVTSADCAAGFACVGDDTAGVCRNYCCLDPEACPEATHCGVRTSRDALHDDPEAEFLVPVCVPADDCELLPGPGGTNRCSDGLMCAIVRADGTTACVLPGTAGEGEPCAVVGSGHSPCAEGYVCSKATNTCLELCRINEPDACAGGVCQGGTGGIPDEYGVCVGARD